MQVKKITHIHIKQISNLTDVVSCISDSTQQHSDMYMNVVINILRIKIFIIEI